VRVITGEPLNDLVASGKRYGYSGKLFSSENEQGWKRAGSEGAKAPESGSKEEKNRKAEH